VSLSIISQPSSPPINSGLTAALTVVAAGPPGAPLAYQWFQGKSGDTSSPVASATNTSLTTRPLATNSNFWVRVRNATTGATVDSATASVVVNQVGAPILSGQPSSPPIGAGQQAILTVVATGPVGAALTYQWFRGNSGDTTTPVAGATAASLTTAALAANASFWVRVTNATTGASVDSAVATIVVNLPGAPAISGQPNGVAIKGGQTATLTVAATGPVGASLTYQWFEGNSGDTSNPMAGATGASFTTPPLATTENFWVRVTNATTGDAVNSSTVTVTVSQSLVINNVPPSPLIGVVSSLRKSVDGRTSAPP
jgi:hypothetical protein